MNKRLYLIRKNAIEQIGSALEEYHIVYIGAHTGWGKTTTAQLWIENKNRQALYLSVKNGVEQIAEKLQKVTAEEVVVIDDVYGMSEEDEQILADAVAECTDCRFLIMGRIALPAWLKIYKITNQLMDFGVLLLQFQEKDIFRYLRQNGLTTDRVTVERIVKRTYGWPAAIRMMVAHMAQGKELTDALMDQVTYDMYEYFDTNIFRTWNVELQHFIMKICDFDKINTPMACAVSGRADAGLLLKQLMRQGSFLTLTPPDKYEMHFFFKDFLRQKQNVLYTKEKINRLYYSAAIYYEQNGNLREALKYYQRAGDTDKLSELLIQTSNMHVGRREFYELEEYYKALPQEDILSSPELMSGMCMMKSMKFLPKEAEEWYERLAEFAKQIPKNDSRYKTAVEKLAYLGIALPHRGSKKLISIIKDVGVLCRSKSLCVQEMSVTGNCPSLLHGGKDFTSWMASDTVMYRVMKLPLELILGAGGVGLADIAIGESIYEKSAENVYVEAVIKVNSGLTEAIRRGTDQICFAGKGIMGKIYVAEGNLSAALDMMMKFREHIAGQKNQYLLENIDAYITKLYLYQADTERAAFWMNHTPDEMIEFRIIDRYIYLMKIRIYIMQENFTQAVALIHQMLEYCKSYERKYEESEVYLLNALLYYRMGSGQWQEELVKALRECEKIKIYRMIADEGAAVLPMLEKISYDGSSEYLLRLIELTKQQAAYYPDYCRQIKKQKFVLNQTEEFLIRLLGQGMSNAQIAQEMNITVRTVKFHLTNIYQKLEVSNRTQAVNMARSIGILS